jgi:hypothetical protein
MKYKQLLHGLAMSWISETKNPTECSFDELQQAQKEPTPRMSKQNWPEMLPRDLGPVQLG